MNEETKENVPAEEVGAVNTQGTGGDVLTPAAPTATDSQKISTDKKAFNTLDDEEGYSNEEFAQLANLYEETLSDFVSGEVVTGKVLAVNEKEVAVDIGFKSEGVIPIDEFDDPSSIQVGQDIQVFIDDIEDPDGMLVLSKKKADFMRIWDLVNQSYDRGEIVKGKCVRRIKGGIVVDLNGVDAFLPGSQIDVRPIRDFDALIGQMMDFKIVKINNLRKNIVVSHRALVEEAMKGQREKILADLQKGQVLEGTVKNITDFGVFIDLGGVDGLLHINDLSWGRVAHPSEVVGLDQKIKVIVLDYNEDKDRISLGLKQLQPHPWEDVGAKYPVGSVVRGKVVSISDYGAFVELERGVEGLIHISEMSWTQHIKHPSKILAVGEMLDAKVLNINKEERKISLGLKQLEPDPWETLAERYPIGSRHTGKVRNLTNFGAFVELEEGIDGLIHISDLSWTKKIRHPGEVVKKGDEIEVIVLNVDKDNRRISLGYKQTQDNPWDTLEDKYKPNTITQGKVIRLIEKGLIVELPESVDGFVPMSQLVKENLTKPADGYQIDDLLTLTVIEFNKDSKKIVLSEKGYSKLEEKDLKAVEEISALEAELSVPEPPKKKEKKADEDLPQVLQ
ncbi:30S ribosomal protein S1 [bacterium]|nr:30S ribosomal protein S1 [bacterium]